MPAEVTYLDVTMVLDLPGDEPRTYEHSKHYFSSDATDAFSEGDVICLRVRWLRRLQAVRLQLPEKVRLAHRERFRLDPCARSSGRPASGDGSGQPCDNWCRPDMASSPPARVLIVAHRTAATPLLLNAVRARAKRSSCSFTLLVPRPYWDPDTDEAAATLELAIPVLEDAAGGHVGGIIGDTDPFVAVREAVTSIGIDEIIISTLPVRVSHWLRRDLPHRVEQFGLPVTVVTAQQSERAVSDRR